MDLQEEGKEGKNALVFSITVMKLMSPLFYLWNLVNPLMIPSLLNDDPDDSIH